MTAMQQVILMLFMDSGQPAVTPGMPTPSGTIFGIRDQDNASPQCAHSAGRGPVKTDFSGHRETVDYNLSYPIGAQQPLPCTGRWACVRDQGNGRVQGKCGMAERAM